ncbi:hypothetical protein [Burkholderia sp. PAMC 28687]|uniref:hypothetical protein n=1 Tax=Burkholderia sp. PAMC 28687 TaxID=1795874 RepID=UPI000A97BAB8|nr:hypothetical protein [Burkholderia sp. PAMC 28687]
MLYDGDKLVAEYDSSGNLVKRYVHGPGTDEPIVSYDGLGVTSKTWMLADYKGCIVATMDVKGVGTGAFSYGPLGETSGVNRPRFMFTGQQYFGDLGLGLYYYKARFLLAEPWTVPSNRSGGDEGRSEPVCVCGE